jgi:hypothetical protein
VVLLGDEAQVEARFRILKIVLILTQVGARFVPNKPQPQKSFWMHPMELQGDVGHVESHFDPFGHSVFVGSREVHGLC